jgi:Tol biopolymer transport system component
MMALALAISAAVSCDGPPGDKKAARDASQVPVSAAPSLPGRIYVAGRRPVQHAGTRDEVISLDPNTSEWRTEPIRPCSAWCLRVSPSGTMAAYSRFAGYDAVFACALDGSSQEVRLLSGPAYSLTWAPDGERVIVTTCAYKSVNRQSVLRMETWMVNADGTGRARLPIPDTHTVLDSSADGRFLLTFVPPKTQPYDSVPNFPCVLYVMRPDGTGARRVTAEGENSRYGRFSPDSDRIAYQTSAGPRRGTVPRRSLYKFAVSITNLNGTDRKEVVREDSTGVPRHMSWSPDGRFLAVEIGRWTEGSWGVSFHSECMWIDIYDSSGQRVRTLRCDELKFPEGESLDWR